MKMTDQTYDDLIIEAFVKPIRSVLIVDDDYPTMHEILLDPTEQAKLYGDKKWKKDSANRKKVRAVIDEFRKPDAPYLLDIHDGSSPSEEKDRQQVEKLQQTDLLVLDYQLDRNNVKDGTAAIAIARKTLTNRHFNLILVHTQEPLDEIFYKFVVGLMSACFQDVGDPDAELQTFLDTHEDALLATINDNQYASAQQIHGTKANALKGQLFSNPVWASTREILHVGKLALNKFEEAVLHVLSIYEGTISKRLSAEDIGVIDWSDGDVKFIRAAKGFIAFKNKSEKDDDEALIPALERALIHWNPMPSRLTLTKLRAEMNQGGIEVQDDALGEREVGAVWYLRMLEQDESRVDAVVDRIVRNHSEQLLDRLVPDVSDFTKRIHGVDYKSKPDPHDIVKGRFKIDLKVPGDLEKARMGHNAFVGSKPVLIGHLDLGHILQVGADYWVCVTPACDMVPNRQRGSAPDTHDGIKRFTAVKLFQVTPKTALKSAQRGGHVFANIQTEANFREKMAFQIGANESSQPTWMIMYADEDGLLSKVEGIPTCNISFISPVEKEGGGSEPGMTRHASKIRGMLRYEYALEIQSGFVRSQARIGLDFEATAPQATEDAAKKAAE